MTMFCQKVKAFNPSCHPLLDPRIVNNVSQSASTLPPKANWDCIFSDFSEPASFRSRSSEARKQSFAHPATMHALSATVLLTMAFCNFLLKCHNMSWKLWCKHQCKPLFGSFKSKSLRLICDADNPDSVITKTLLKITKQTIAATVNSDDLPPVEPHKRPNNSVIRPNPQKRVLLATLGLPATQGTMGDSLSLRSKRLGRDQLRKHRGFNGMLETKHLPDDARSIVRDTISNDNSAFLTAIKQTTTCDSEAFLQTAKSHSTPSSTLDVPPLAPTFK